MIWRKRLKGDKYPLGTHVSTPPLYMAYSSLLSMCKITKKKQNDQT